MGKHILEQLRFMRGVVAAGNSANLRGIEVVDAGILWIFMLDNQSLMGQPLYALRNSTFGNQMRQCYIADFL